MPLTICTTADQRLVGAEAQDALRLALAREGRALLLVPSFAEQLAACRQLAAADGLSLGVTVTTPSAWVAERWEVWGDGRLIIDRNARTAALGMVAEDGGGGACKNPGTVRLLARLASDALPWIARDDKGRIDQVALVASGLTEAEAAAVGLLDRYEELLARLGLIEEPAAAVLLDGLLGKGGGSVWPTVAVGFERLTREQRELLASLAAQADVTVVATGGNAAAHAIRDGEVEDVARRCSERGIPVSRCSAESEDEGNATRDPELAALLGQVFAGGDEPLAATGAVSVLAPAGPLAEAEAVAGEVLRLRDAGAREVAVSAVDVTRAWRELAPKLACRGVSVGAELSEPFESLEAGRAFLEFAEQVAQLSELAASWPEPVQTEEGTLLRLGDMGWWPPCALSDFLLSGIAHMDRRRAQALDRRWRQDRLLTPAAVLETLQNPAKTSPAVAAATTELLRGRLGSAASKLLAPFAHAQVPGDGGPAAADAAEPQPGGDGSAARSDPLADERAAKALEAVMTAGRTLRQLGVTADPTSEHAIPLSRLVALARQLLSGVRVVTRPKVEVDSATCRVRIVSPSQLASLEPASADAVVCCGHTAAEMPIGTGDDAASAILEKLGVEPAADPMSEARATFWRGLGVARGHVTLERTLFDADSKDAYPSVMLSEVMACYAEGALPASSLPETPAVRNLSSVAADPVPSGGETPAPAGAVTGSARGLINVPREGQAELPGGRPVLSASQIESYLECPYKWFSLRRLRLEDSDVGFAPVQMGTFAHRVLEVTHATLLAEGLAAMGPAAPDLDATPQARVPGSRVSAADPAGIAHAKRLLADELDAHTRHMFLQRRKGDPRSALVPHTAQDEGLLHTLRRDLESVIDYEAGILEGFEPRLFEWDFGKGEPEPYAGAYIRGTVDRVDVSAHGGAVVIDYKHRRGAGLMGEYAALPADGGAGGFVLPRHVQSLIYGQVVRRHFPQLHVQGATYLTTGGQTHALSGAIDEDQLDLVYGAHPPSKKALPGVSVGREEPFGQEGERGMDALLDATEEAIGEAIGRMMDGDIEARPLDARACDWCPVMNCERRLSK